MIPYFQISNFNILGFSFHLFEVLTSIGIFLGIQSCLKAAKIQNLNMKNMIDAIIIALVVGFIGAHWMHVWLYEKDFSHPLRLLQFSQGISSTGGLIAGAAGCWIFLRLKKLPILIYGDPLVYGVFVAMIWGRLGCTVAHDHLGKLSDLPWAFQYPEGARHNLGFEEAMLLLMFFLVVQIPRIKNWIDVRAGRWVGLATLYYGLVRLGLDFLRAEDLPVSDARYMGLTPAQYVCFFFIGVGAWLIYKRKAFE